MRILIVNTSEKTGGAAVAANRLMEALNANGMKAKMLVRDKETHHLAVSALPQKTWMLQFHFLWERLVVWLHLHLRREHLFEIDIANAGTDITRLREYQEADIVHLHWVNQGMLSLRTIRKIAAEKHVVWTMHDLWPASSICHLSLNCRRFEQQCHHCRLLPAGGSQNDLSASVWKKKQRMLENRRITFVACSEWLAGEARKSALLKGQTVYSIPNPIDTRLYRPADREKARAALGLPAGRRIILFVSQRVTNPNKGMQYLVEACRLMAAQQPEQVGNTAVAVLGGHAEEIVGLLPFDTFALGYVNDEHRIAQVYNAADVFVLPSLSENLPNTIMEAMACGVPCVGFRVGGIPEMIDHQENGYVAEYENAEDLAAGMRWTLEQTAAGDALQRNCLKKVARCYSQSSVANKYIDVYQQTLRPQQQKR